MAKTKPQLIVLLQVGHKFCKCYFLGLLKFRSIFRKEAYASAFLISGSNFFDSFIAYGNKECLKDTV